MSECIIKLQIGDQIISKKVDSNNLPQSLEDFRNLFDDQEWESIISSVKVTLQNRTQLKVPNLKNINSRPIPNTSIGVLSQRFPNMNFPEKFLDRKVLFVDKYVTDRGELNYGIYKTGRKDIYGLDEEIYVVDRKHLSNLSSYLTLLNFCEENKILEHLPDEYEDQLTKILEVLDKEKTKEGESKFPDIKNIKSLLFDFLARKDRYSKLDFLYNGERLNVKTVLTLISSDIFNVGYIQKFDSDFLNSVFRNVKWGKNFKTASISENQVIQWITSDVKNSLNSLIKVLDPKLFKDSTDKIRTLLNLKVNDIGEGNLNLYLPNIIQNKKLDKDLKLWNYIFEYYNDMDPNFKLKYKESKKDKNVYKIFFSAEYTNMKYFNIGFDSLVKVNDISRYKGKFISKINQKYYVTNNYPTESQYTKQFNTLEDAQIYVDKIILNERINDNSFLDFHNLSSDESITQVTNEHKVYKKGDIIEILDIKFKGYFNPITSIQEFLKDNPTLQQTLKFIYSLDFIRNDETIIKEIDENINSPEKAFLFLKGLQYLKDEEKNAKGISSLVRKIKQSKVKRFYIQNYDKFSNKSTVINIDSKKESLPKGVYGSIPMTLWQAAGDVLGKTFGINLVIDTEFKDDSVKDSKAYIITNEEGKTEVHINLKNASSQDLFHEYAHIALAIVRQVQGMNAYRTLLQRVWDLGEKDLLRKEIETDTYKYATLESKMEEYFVSKFGAWACYNIQDSKFGSIFGEKKFKDTFKIFGGNSKSLSEIGRSTVEVVFKSFSKEIGSYLRENKSIGEGFESKFKLYRQKNNWIEKQISEGKIKEDCR